MTLERLGLLLALVLCVVACGDAEIGDACDETGKRGDCEEGAVCTNEDDGSVCRRVCAEQSDCAAGEDCNGVSGTSIKSCQPKNDDSKSAAGRGG